MSRLRIFLPLLAAAFSVAACDEGRDVPDPTLSGPDYPPRGEVVSGDLQQGTVDDALPQPIVVRVTDQGGRAIAGTTVTFVVTAGRGTLFAATSETNAAGHASNRWTLGTVAGDTQRVEARMIDPESGQPVELATFRAVARADVPVSIAARPPAARTGGAGQALGDSLEAQVLDAFGNPVPGVTVAWSTQTGSVSPATSTTDAAGIARTEWTLGAQVGPQTAEAFLSPAVRAQFTAAAGVPLGATLTVLAGNDQTATVGTALPDAVVVLLRSTLGQAIAGASITWTPAAGSGTATPPVSTTGPDGQASTRWTLGNGAGPQQVTASVPGVTQVAVGATAIAGAASRLQVLAGNNQTAPPNAPLAELLATRVLDAQGNLVPGATVTWTVLTGGGSVTQSSLTGADGVAQARWTLGPAQGAQTARATVAGAASADFTADAQPGPLASLQVTPATVSFDAFGATQQLAARPADAYGNTAAPVTVTWTTTNAAVATVSQSGLVTAVGNGTAQIRASGGGQVGTSDVRVRQQAATVTLTSRTTSIIELDTLVYTAVARDARGQPVAGATVAWTTESAAVATVSPGGVVTGRGAGQTFITATVDGRTARRTVTSYAAQRSDTLAVGAHHSCTREGGTVDCWGSNVARQLAFAGADRSLLPRTVEGVAFASVTAGDNWSTYEYYQSHTCGVQADGDAYCWGSNDGGQMGSDNSGQAGSCGNFELYYVLICEEAPTVVQGGMTWRQLDAGANHTCGVTTAGVVYCWGRSDQGQLGTTEPVGECLFDRGVGSERMYPCARTPRQVATAQTFRQVSAGDDFSCGLTTGGQAYCWGRNTLGQLGDGSTTMRTTPVAVQGGIGFARISAGRTHVCGVTPGGGVYCWGNNDRGQLGIGSVGGVRTSPQQVAASGYARVAAGRLHNCGVTTGGTVQCWGENENGQLGDGTVTDRQLPTPIASQYAFDDVGAGGNFSCGRSTAGGAVFCWGLTAYGQLGTGIGGVTRASPIPGAVRAQ